MATLIVPEHFSHVEDAEALQKACKGNLSNIYIHAFLHIVICNLHTYSHVNMLPFACN
jgi:hypothetical protein